MDCSPHGSMPPYHSFFSFFGCAGSLLLRGLFSSCGKWGLLFSCSAQASHCSGFSCCRAWALRARASVGVAPGLWSTGSVVWHTGLVAPRCVGSSRTRNGIRVSCIGRWILYHWATREAHQVCFEISIQLLENISESQSFHTIFLPHLCLPQLPLDEDVSLENGYSFLNSLWI